MVTIETRVTDAVILSLILVCMHLSIYIININKNRRTIYLSLLSMEILTLYLANHVASLLLIIVIIFELVDLLLEEEFFYPVCILALLICSYIFYSNIHLFVAKLLVALGIFFTRYINVKLLYYKELDIDSKAIISHQNRQIAELKEHGKTIKEVAILEERNRFSGRIHDKLGHSVSGSIILLEATLLIFDTQTQKAKENISRAVDNLRNGVDDIRKSLREERPKLPILNLTEIKVVLEQFTLEYGIAAGIEINSDLENIQIEIWQCIHENLKEVLTNLLKHSNATYFKLSITVTNKIIRIEYINNGVIGELGKKGIGLMSIEERTSFLGGTCLALLEDGLFTLSNVFISNDY